MGSNETLATLTAVYTHFYARVEDIAVIDKVWPTLAAAFSGGLNWSETQYVTHDAYTAYFRSGPY